MKKETSVQIIQITSVPLSEVLSQTGYAIFGLGNDGKAYILQSGEWHSLMN